MVDKIVPEDTITGPYWDDYDETKGYYRILFRPGYGVQARELTQLQTILQKQVQRFGDSIYKQGSMVTGGEITYLGASDGVRYLNVSSSITASEFEGDVIISQNTSMAGMQARAVVLTSAELDSSDPATLIIRPLNSIEFHNSDTINILNDSANSATLASSGACGYASAVSINEGVYYYNGYFVRVGQQTIALDKYGNTPSYRVGLEFTDAIVDEGDDSSLLDPAQGESNYQAPGATRYQIALTLAKRSIDSTDDTSFIELMRVEAGTVVKKIMYPEYSELEKTLARRTFDESGSYTVRPFIGTLREHIADTIVGNVSVTGTTMTGVGTQFILDAPVGSTISARNYTLGVTAVADNTSLTVSNSATIPAGTLAVVSNPNKFTFRLTPGKAYVKGFEFETISDTSLSVRRGRDTQNVSNFAQPSPIGNYIFVNNVYGLPDVSSQEIYDLHQVTANAINFGTSSDYATTVIGNTRVSGFEFSSYGTLADANTHIYKAYLTEVMLNSSTKSFDNVKSLAIGATYHATAGNVAYNKRMSLTGSSGGANNSFITDTNFDCLIFPFPQSGIAASSISPAADNAYYLRRYASGVTFTSGVYTIPAPPITGETYLTVGTDSANLAHFVVTVRDNLGTALPNGQVFPIVSSNSRSVTISGTQATINVNTPTTTFTGDVMYSTTWASTTPAKRTKSLIYGTSSVYTANSLASGTVVLSNTIVRLANGEAQVCIQNSAVKRTVGDPMNLYIADIVSLNKVLDLNGTLPTTANMALATDVTSRFLLDNGQRDTMYRHGSIALKSGYTPPLGPLVVSVNFYSHAGYGHLCVDSYPNATTNDGYTNILSYVSPTTGRVYNLTDCIDWRPKRINGSAANTVTHSDAGTGVSVISPESPTGFLTSYAFYMGRVDKIVLTKERKFKVIEGTPSLAPEPPVHDAEDMLIYTLVIPPYTFRPVDVEVHYNDNRRYTMRDIGSIDRRLKNVEYYTALNLLEKATESLVVLDSSGNNRFKNGMLADNFTGHKVGDVSAYDYACSIDYERATLYPMFMANNLNFVANNNPVYLDRTVVDCNIKQEYSSSYEVVNPDVIETVSGSLWLSPDNRTWHDRSIRPQVLTNIQGENDNYEFIGTNNDTRDQVYLPNLGQPVVTEPYQMYGYGTRFNDWSASWHGIPVSLMTRDDNFLSGTVLSSGYRYAPERDVADFTTTIPTGDLVSPGVIVTPIDNTVVDQSIQPYIPATDVLCVGTRMAPFTIVYPFFDEKPIQSYWIQANKITVNTTSNVANSLAFSPSNNEFLTTSSGGRGQLLLRPVPTSVANSVISNMLHVVNMSGFWNIGDTITSSSGYQVKLLNKFYLTDNVRSVNANTMQIDFANTASNTSNNHYVNSLVNIAKGTGAGQISLITGYDSINRRANVSPAWNVAPDNTSVYSIGTPVTTGFGSVAGVIALPMGNCAAYTVGTKIVRLTSSPTNDTGNNVITKAAANFYVNGLISVSPDLCALRPLGSYMEGTEYNYTNNPFTEELLASGVVRPPVSYVTANNMTTTSVCINTTVVPPPVTQNTCGGVNVDIGGGFNTIDVFVMINQGLPILNGWTINGIGLDGLGGF